MSDSHATRRALAGRAVAELARTVAQRWRPGPVPRTPSDITPAWLSELLGRRVDEIAVCDEEHGTATRARLTRSGNDVPATVFVKTTPTRPIERLFHNVYGLGETEAVFYRFGGAGDRGVHAGAVRDTVGCTHRPVGGGDRRSCRA